MSHGHGPFWWGAGAPPLERWPGVTIDIPTVWRSATSRWESPDGLFFFDATAADTACDFFPDLLKHHIGHFVGQPFALMEYQSKLMTRPLFGWRLVADGYRRFRKLFGFLPKGAGKSPWAAGTGIYLARCDGEAAAEVYAVANDRQQARTVHDNAKIMVEQSPLLMKGCEILKDSILWKASHSMYMVLSSDASTAHGKRPHGVIFDELHGQPERDLYEALAKSMIKRRQPLMLIITHAGTNEDGICFEEYEYAKGVLGGMNPDPTCLPVIFEMTSADDWTDPDVWRRVHPGFGVTVRADAVAAECAAARTDPRKQNDFKRFIGNVWTNQATAWIPIEWWDACNAEMPSDDELKKYPCAVGIDMAQKIDLAAGVIAFKLPLEDDEEAPEIEVVQEDDAAEKIIRSLDFRVALIPAFWLPENTIADRARQDGVRYDLWAKEELNGLKLCFSVDGAVIGADPIVKYFTGRDGRSGALKRFPRLKGAEFAYDPAFATDVALNLRDTYGLKTVEVPQNHRHLSESCQIFEALVKAGRIIHGGHKLLRWNMENVAIRTDDSLRIRPVKPRKATKRIDGVVAAIMAIGRLLLLPPERLKKKGGPKIWTLGGWVSAIPRKDGDGAAQVP